jgi:inner membrane protein
MDPITHTLAGAAMARAGLDRRTPLAAATLMLAANAPDIDILAMAAGSYPALAFRRGWTHGPIALVLLPFAVTVLIVLWDRWVRLRRDPRATPIDERMVLLLAAIGVLSHPLLDWLNTYGIRLLMPFRDRWFHGDALFIVDPWIWLALATALWLPHRTAWRVRLVGGLVVAYILAMVAASAAAESIGRRAAEGQGFTGIEEVLFQPAPGNPFVGELIVATRTEYRVGSFEWFSVARVRLDGPAIARGDWASSAVVRAARTEDGTDYLTWARMPFVRLEVAGSDTVVVFGDARFRAGPAAGGLQGVRIVVGQRPVDGR